MQHDKEKGRIKFFSHYRVRVAECEKNGTSKTKEKNEIQT